MQTHNSKPKRRLLHKKHHRISFYTLLTLLAIPLLAFAVFIARLQSGPIQVPFVGAAVENAVNKSLNGSYVISVNSAVLEKGGDNLVALRLQNMNLYNDKGKLVGSAPFATADLDILSFVKLKPSASSITLIGPVMVLLWNRAGEIELVPGLVPNLGETPSPEKAETQARPAKEDYIAENDIAASGSDFLTTGLSQALRKAFEAMPVRANGLQNMQVKSAILRVQHEETGAIWRVAPINFSANATAKERVFEVNASVLEGSRPWRITARLSGMDELSDKSMVVGIDDLVLAAGTGPLARFSGLPLDAPLSSLFSGTLSPEGEWSDLNFKSNLGRGEVRLGKNKTPLEFKGASMELNKTPEAWNVQRFEVQIADTVMTLGGNISPEPNERFAVDLTAQYQALSGELAQSLPEANAIFQGVVSLASQSVSFSKLELRTPSVTLASQASGGWAEGQPRFDLSGRASSISVSDLKAIWPAFLLPGVRDWIYTNLKSGITNNISYDLSLSDDGNGLMRRFSAGFDNMSFAYFKDLPPIQNASGALLLDGNTFLATLDKGEIEAVPGGLIKVDGSSWKTELTGASKPDIAHLHVVAKSDAAPALYYLDHPALALLQKNQIKVNEVSGGLTADAKFEFPLMENMPETEFKRDIRAKLSNFSAAGIIPERSLQNGDFDIVINDKGLEVSGTGLVDGAKVTLTAMQKAEQGSKLNYNGLATLDAKARANFGLPTSDILKGPVKVIFNGSGSDLPERITVDLGQADVDIVQLGYYKPAGIPAQLGFGFSQNQQKTEITLNDLRYLSGLVEVEGKAKISPKTGLISATLPVFKFQEGDDFSIEISRKNKGYAIDLRGARFNVEPFIKARKTKKRAAKGNASSTSSPPLYVTSSIGVLVGANKQLIRNAQVSFNLIEGQLKNMDVQAAHAEGGALFGKQDGNSIFLESQNAGSLLRFADVYTSMRGGNLVLNAQQNNKAIAGAVTVTNFSVVNDKVVNTIAGANNQPSEIGQLRKIAQAGIGFDVFSTNFNFDENALLRITRLKVNGPTAGATGDGFVNFKSSEVRFDGTFVPAFALNNMFANLPVLGNILGRNKDEGLFGITFFVKGTVEKPTVTVQPLSAITPGIFRKIFE